QLRRVQRQSVRGLARPLRLPRLTYVPGVCPALAPVGRHPESGPSDLKASWPRNAGRCSNAAQPSGRRSLGPITPTPPLPVGRSTPLPHDESHQCFHCPRQALAQCAHELFPITQPLAFAHEEGKAGTAASSGPENPLPRDVGLLSLFIPPLRRRIRSRENH